MSDSQYSQEAIRTVFDYSVAMILLVLLFPVGLLLSLIIWATDKGPVLYVQKRSGKNGRIFNFYKLRSMKRGTEDGIPLLSGKKDKRITPIGRFMRKHRLDEIPNFINVLKGEMSIVGPRPEQPYFTELILKSKPEYSLISTIKPGITSWGMVRYGYAANLEQLLERADFDIHYIKNRSLWFDLKIIFQTIGLILKGEGV